MHSAFIRGLGRGTLRMMTPSLDQWTPPCGSAPYLRIGIVLPEDERTILDLETPLAPRGLIACDAPERRRCLSAAPVVFELVGERVSARVGSERVGVAPEWRLYGAEKEDILILRQRIGRGFHWEKNIDLLVPGDLEVSARQGRLLLVARIPTEHYLLGVITSEMAGECPLEFLKAQGVVARSWTLAHTERKHEDLGFDFCNDDCCQRFHGVGATSTSARRALTETLGKVLLAPDGFVVDANYSKCCGGVTEDPRFVWGRSKPGLSSQADAPASSPLQRLVPVREAGLAEYLRGRWLVECDAYCSPNAVSAEELAKFLGRVDTGEGFFRWRIEYRREQLEALLRTKLFAPLQASPADALATLTDLRVTARGLSGRATEVVLTYRDAGGREHRRTISDQYRIRQVLHESFLYSTAFQIEVVRQADGLPEAIVLTGAGWGHGAGLCQIGALGMALQGFDYRQILAHYFREAVLRRVY